MPKRVVLIALLSALLILGVAGAWRHAHHLIKDPDVAKIEQMRDEVYQEARVKNLKPEELVERLQQVKDAAKDLTERQQNQLKQSSSKAFRRMMDERLRTYISLPEEEKKAFLDEEIDRKEAWTARWKKDRTSSPAKGRQSGKGKWKNLTQEQWREMQRKKLDGTTPEQRAMWEVYLDDFHKRREERGLEPLGQGWKRASGIGHR